MLQKLILIIALTFINQSISAQATLSSLKGIITTKDKLKAASVVVVLKENKKTTVTNSQGEFVFDNLKQGNYTLYIAYEGMKSYAKIIFIPNDSTQVLHNIQLVENIEQLNEVLVTTNNNSILKPTAIGKLPIAAMDLPQATITLDKQLLERQQVQTIGDAIQNVSGVYVMGTTGGYQEELGARGFAFGSNNTFKNGVRFNNSMMPEVSGIETMEVLKGGNALLFGTVGAGGVLNIITKKPKTNFSGSVALQTGSFGLVKPSFDIYGAINKNKTIAYRLNGSFTAANSFRDQLQSKRYYINPSLLFKLSKKTELLIETDYTKDDRNLDFGTGAIYYQLAPTPRNLYLNLPWSNVQSQQLAATATLTTQINNNWQFRSVVSIRNFENEIFGAARPNSNSQFIDSSKLNYGRWVRGLVRNKTDDRYRFASFDVTGKFATGKVNHLVLAGFDVDKSTTENYIFDFTKYRADGRNIYDTINIFGTKQYNTRTDVPNVPWNFYTVAPLTRVGFYLQDFISVGNKIKILTGLRYTLNNIGRLDSIYANNSSRLYNDVRKNNALSPKLGLLIQPTRNISAFTSYTNSYEINTAVDTFGNVLQPSIIDQFEIGVKTLLLKNRVSINATAYIINNTNAVQSYPNLAPADPRRQIGGQTQSKGFELDVATKPINGVTINAGYSFNETRYVKSTLFIEGSQLRYIPNHTANLRLYYAPNGIKKLNGLNAGISIFYFGDRVAGRSTTKANPNFALIPLPSYYLLEASVGYNLKNINLRLKVNNLLNELSYNVHDDNSVNPIAPRQLTATVAYKF
jgi:iron complex outermembrane recepter protein